MGDELEVSLELLNGQLKDAPLEMEIPAGLLAELRRIDSAIASLQAEQRGLVNGFLWGAGVDLVQNRVSLDLASGLCTVVRSK